MSGSLATALDGVLRYAVNGAGGVPGVVAVVTDRHGPLYEGAFGTRQLGTTQPMTLDTVMAIFSTTKALTGTALMQLVEEGRVHLDAPASTYVPALAAIQVLDGFDPDGQPRTRPPRTPITVRHLMLHTAGFGYEFFHEADLRYRTARGIPSIITNTVAAITTVLLHDPGERWTYGVNIDWVGQIIEAVCGKRLSEVLRERLFDPLEMRDIGFVLTPAMQARRAVIHQRAPEGTLTPLPDLILPQPPEMDMGGHGLYASIPEYAKFIRMLLNDGAGPHGQVLKPETVRFMAQNGLGGLKVGGWTAVLPNLTNSGEFFPGLSKSWGYTFLINDAPTPTGRPAGQLMWAGLANQYYWIDRQNGIGGYWSTQVLPFQDVAAYPNYLEFESTVYAHLRKD